MLFRGFCKRFLIFGPSFDNYNKNATFQDSNGALLTQASTTCDSNTEIPCPDNCGCVHCKKIFPLLYIQLHTIEYEINVQVRLLISQTFSHRYALILDGTFIEIGIFQNWKS